MDSFRDKVVLITGTGGGLGQEAALRFAAAGATVVGCDLHVDAQQRSAARLAQQGLVLHGEGGVDLGDPQQARHWVETAAAHFGRIDVVFNNASAARFGRMADFAVEDWYYTIRNELDLVFFVTKFAWPHLGAGSVILNMGSTAAWCGTTATGKVAHAATKGGVVAMTRQLAAEGAARGIRAVSISPGVIRTPGTAAFLDDPQMQARLLQGVPLNRAGEPADVIALALFLASEQAGFITGADYVVDGGMLAV
jgi:NAD(P)-dependent dehydrogenase (short-subunit alcohol dehydrogenase family)